MTNKETEHQVLNTEFKKSIVFCSQGISYLHMETEHEVSKWYH